jgi:hypothetical protein
MLTPRPESTSTAGASRSGRSIGGNRLEVRCSLVSPPLGEDQGDVASPLEVGPLGAGGEERISSLPRAGWPARRTSQPCLWLASRYDEVVKNEDESVWLPPSSIASTSHSYSVFG